MEAPDITKWPLVYQILGGIGALFTGALIWLRGSKFNSDNSDDGEAARLRRERDRLLQARDDQISDNIKAVRADLALIVEALKKSIEGQFKEQDVHLDSIDNRLQKIETQIAIFEDRERRGDGAKHR